LLNFKTQVSNEESPGSGLGLGLSIFASPAKSPLKPSLGPGLARAFLAWLGPAWGFKPEPAHHYGRQRPMENKLRNKPKVIRTNSHIFQTIFPNDIQGQNRRNIPGPEGRTTN
jgi:hypothetical protein